LKRGPDDPALRAVLAATLLAEGRTADCVASANAALDRAPEALDPLLVRGLCFLAAGNSPAAERDLTSVLERDPQRQEARAELALLRARRGDLEGASLVLEEGLALGASAGLAATLGMVRAEQGRFAEAAALLEHTHHDPTVGAEPAIAYAEALARMGRDAAEVDAARAIARARDPRHPALGR
jgi:Tfp pilus assembly protein PilF